MAGAPLDDHRLRGLIAAGRGLVAQLDLEVVLDRLLGTASELTSARYAALGVLDERRRELERFATRGVDAATEREIGSLPRGRGILGVLIDDPRPLRLADLRTDPRSYGVPAGHPPMRSFLGVPILVRGEAWGNLYLSEKEGGAEFDEADEETVVILAEWAAIAIDNARLYRRVERRRDELERAVQGLEATTAIARAVGGETRLDRVLELIVKRGRALVEARALVILLQEGGDLLLAAGAGDFDGEALGRRLREEGTTWGEVRRSGRAERIADVPSRLRISAERLGVREAATALLVPLSFRGRGLGVLAAFDRLTRDPAFGDDEEHLMAAFAASAATAVATAKSVQRERLRESLEAAERERRRWARELHDETLQGLGALRVLLASALRRGDPAGLQDAVRDSIEQAGREIGALRALISDLRPAALDELGLAPAIESLADRVAAAEDLMIDSDVRLARRLTPELETIVYRVVQESLTNVTKHAGARRVAISVAEDAGLVAIEVRDDGRGFDADERRAGFGLIGMQERCALAGGELELVSSPGAGTTVRASLPAPTDAGRAADTA